MPECPESSEGKGKCNGTRECAYNVNGREIVKQSIPLSEVGMYIRTIRLPLITHVSVIRTNHPKTPTRPWT